MFHAFHKATRALAKSGAIVAIPATSMFGCSNAPSVDERIHQQIVVTKFDPSANFGGFSTFSITGNIPIRTAIDGGMGSDLDPAVAGPTLAAVASQMVSRGYVQVDHTAGPDLGISVTLVLQINVAAPTSPWWYGDTSATASYWGLPGSSPVVASWSYVSAAWLSGTMIIDILDVHDAALRDTALGLSAEEDASGSMMPAASINDVWAAFIHGVVLPNLAQPLNMPPIALVNQAFAQSPYLQRAPPGGQNR
jgi:hypothetical protein